MKYIDTHSHLNLSAFNDDIEAVIASCNERDVAVINIGTKEATSARAVELALQNESMYAIIGLHPIQTAPAFHDEEELGEGSTAFLSKGEKFDVDFYRDLAKKGMVVGVGECGFDYYHTTAGSYAVQEEAFIAQIQFANEIGVPLMIHTRGPKPNEESPTGRSVYADVYDVLKQYAKVPFNVHFYAGTYQEAKAFFDIGGTVSFTGVITFASVYEELVRNIPLELMHGETDCPYVAPVPYRGKRCEPWMVEEVYKKIAMIRNEDAEMVRLQLLENASKFYRLNK